MKFNSRCLIHGNLLFQSLNYSGMNSFTTCVSLEGNTLEKHAEYCPCKINLHYKMKPTELKTVIAHTFIQFSFNQIRNENEINLCKIVTGSQSLNQT